jgi:Na+/H+-translocating membrane pyrophosphatase
MSDEPSSPDWLPGLGLDFLHRVYRTSAVLALLGLVLLWERFGRAAALGWLLGALLSLLALVGFEWTVRRFIRPEAQSVQSMLLANFAKLALIAGVLVLAYVAALNHWVSLLWVLPGFAMPHLVIILKLVGHKVVELSRGQPR